MPGSVPAVVLDCDPGIDDTLALIYLAGLHTAGAIRLAGVTTSAANARWILQHCAEHILDDVTVVAGHTTPSVRPLTTTPETHGEFGLGYARAPQAIYDQEPSRNWDTVWRDAVGEHEQTHLIVTGPLTNAADFAARYPADMASFKSVTVMGGAVNYRGNTTPTAEWNFWIDPHAARDYFSQTPVEDGPLTTLCSLEQTEQMLLTPVRFRTLLEALGNNPVADILPEIVPFYFKFHDAQGEGYQAQIHDLLTCLIALGRADYRAVDTTIAVEADSELLLGTSVADLRAHWDTALNTHLVREVDIPQAFEEVFRTLAHLDPARHNS